jgi:hypothetical protein
MNKAITKGTLDTGKKYWKCISSDCRYRACGNVQQDRVYKHAAGCKALGRTHPDVRQAIVDLQSGTSLGALLQQGSASSTYSEPPSSHASSPVTVSSASPNEYKRKMPLAVKFRDIDKDILDAVRHGRYEDASTNSDSDTGDESDRDEESLDDGDFMTMPQHQVPNHGRGIPLRPLAPESVANLLSPALLDMLSDTPHAEGIEAGWKGSDVSATDQNFTNDSGDDLENAFADW